MKLSTKGRYATRAMLELADNYGKEHILLKDIARRQEISERYLERIMHTLVSSGLVRSSRGKNGGFSLAKPPEQIRLSDVVQSVEGSVAPVSCVDDTKSCGRADRCAAHDVWKRVKNAVLGVLDSITLKDMSELQRAKVKKNKNEMYYI
jgi:Rrf2 family transcriptional regulator, cysteine metabolism repressor